MQVITKKFSIYVLLLLSVLLAYILIFSSNQYLKYLEAIM